MYRNEQKIRIQIYKQYEVASITESSTIYDMEKQELNIVTTYKSYG